MPRQRRTLVLIRHAKAEAYAQSDRARELTADGSADAVAAGEWLAAQEVTPDRALVSAAARTRATWAAVCRGASFDCEADYDESLYDAGPESVLDLIRLVDDEVGSLVVVGHNPTVAYLAQMLADAEGDAFAEMVTGFPPCSVARFEFDGGWAGLETGAARVVAFHVARG